MKRQTYFDYIVEKLSTLATRIKLEGKFNILGLHQHSENFYAYFFNLLFDWELQNLNAIKQNVEGIDLIDKKNKIIIQVSATATKQKIETALSKNIFNQYKDFNFKFISISKDADNLKTKSFKNPHNINFIPATDIYDVSSILKVILALKIKKQKQVYEFIKQELGSDIDPMKVETNLARIINILAKEDLAKEEHIIQPNVFEIERKIEFNKLDHTKSMIEDYSIHHITIDKLYSEFDKEGVNKSHSLLMSIRSIYQEHKNIFDSNSNMIFSNLIEKIICKVQDSLNYEKIPYDELEYCVKIIVVDAFIRCKIFENPNGYNYVASR